ncbi:DUF1491 family protein [Sphingobium algorifonticola]|nr:DUF1491 family protein [Sphingobium algorifonticola]
MSGPRLAANMLVGALIRQVQQAGGFATVVHRGDPTSGVILLQCLERGKPCGLFERVADGSGGYRIEPCGPSDHLDSPGIDSYIARRRRADPDLWLIELDVAQAERLAAAILR